MPGPGETDRFDDVRLRGFTGRTSVAEVVRLIDQRTAPLPAEEIDFRLGAGRVLAAAVVAAVSVPHFPRAAFDGYAVRSADTSERRPLRIVDESLPGRPACRPVEAGTAIRIMTGAPMPPGADAVLPIEWTEMTSEGVIPTQPVPAGKHVGQVGEDVPAGRVVLEPGRRLRPQDIGLLSSIGVTRIHVVCRPRALILVTGQELLPPGSMPTGFQIVDSNSVVLRALLDRDGGTLIATEYCPDEPDAIQRVLQRDDWDVLLISGGTSVGREDWAPVVVARLGELPVHGVALRPAAPTGLGFVRSRAVFLLPGNPVACLCAYDLFAGRCIRRLGGRSPDLPYRTIEDVVARRLPSARDRLEYCRVIRTDRGIEPVASSGASILSSTVVADGFVLVPPERDGFDAGERVTVYLYDG